MNKSFALLCFLLNPVLAMAQGISLDQAAKHMTVSNGFSVKLVAGEPDIRQPILVKFDDRGRHCLSIQVIQHRGQKQHTQIHHFQLLPNR
ncbi:MAG: hypothetical protein ABGX16_22985 [Pirellulales bacterium]